MVYLEGLMVNHDDLIEEMRLIRRSIRREFFDYPDDLVGAANSVLVRVPT